MFKKVMSAALGVLLVIGSASVGVLAQQTEETREQIILNSAVLEEQYAVSPALNDLVDDILDELITDEMDTYEQVKACYDYLLDNMSYASSMNYLNTSVGYTTCANIYYANGELEGFGAVALAAGKGQCNGYSAAFILLVRRIGLDARLVSGSTLNSGGGYSYHKWAEVVIDGTVYVFDPQLEQSLMKYGLPKYSVFCKTYSQLGARYYKSA